MKRCIIHLPNKIRPEMASASQIRPLKMIAAFRHLGYEVDVVEGYAAERKKAIKRIKHNIRTGMKYDFMYSESSTMPTLLTDPSHLPLHPVLDFHFFKFVRRHGIKIGLFYRDMYWKFPIYKENVQGLKANAAIAMYKYDLRQYNKYLNKLYVPLVQGFAYLENNIDSKLLDVLPPGCDLSEKPGKNERDKEYALTLLYVGGLGSQYSIDILFQAVKQMPQVRLIVCCRENEWDAEAGRLQNYLADNITIEHKSGDELEELYAKADVGMLMLKPDIYREIAMPYKTFEYLGHGLPIIASDHTAVGAFVNNEQIGWTIPYDTDSLTTLLQQLIHEPSLLAEAAETVEEIAPTHTWECRAQKVIDDLTGKVHNG